MYIGDINWKYCRLETSFEFGNIKQHLVTYSAYWKHHFCLNAHIYFTITYIILFSISL